MWDGSPLLPPQAPSSGPTPLEHPQRTAAPAQPGPLRPPPAGQHLGNILLHPAHLSQGKLRHTESCSFPKGRQLWAGSCPDASFPPAANSLRPVPAGSGVGAAAEQGFPALCSPPAPSAHSRHVISCSFFALPIISAPGSAHGGALLPVSRFSHLCWPRARASGSHFPPGPPSSWSRQHGTALSARFGSHLPWTRLQPHTGEGEAASDAWVVPLHTPFSF